MTEIEEDMGIPLEFEIDTIEILDPSMIITFKKKEDFMKWVGGGAYYLEKGEKVNTYISYGPNKEVAYYKERKTK